MFDNDVRFSPYSNFVVITASYTLNFHFLENCLLFQEMSSLLIVAKEAAILALISA